MWSQATRGGTPQESRDVIMRKGTPAQPRPLPQRLWGHRLATLAVREREGDPGSVGTNASLGHHCLTGPIEHPRLPGWGQSRVRGGGKAALQRWLGRGCQTVPITCPGLTAGEEATELWAGRPFDALP